MFSVELTATCTNPEAVGLVSLLMSTICNCVATTSPQALMLPELPAVVSGIPTNGFTQFSEDSNSRAQQSGAGVQVGPGPRIVCMFPVLISQGNLTPFPPNIANSSAMSRAHSAAAKLLVTPSTPGPSVILSSVMMRFPPVGLRTCPLQVKRLRRNSRQLLSSSRSAIVGVLALKTTAFTVNPTNGLPLRLLQVASQEASAACVAPGPYIVYPPLSPRITFISLKKLAAVQFGRIPFAEKRSAPSKASIGCGQKPDPTTVWTLQAQLLKQAVKLGFEKLAFSISKPRGTWLLVQGPAALVKGVILALREEQFQRQVKLSPISEQAEQLYLYPLGHCVLIESGHMLAKEPKPLELASSPWKRVVFIADWEICERLRLTPAKLDPKLLPLGWKLRKSALAKMLEQARGHRRRSASRAALTIFIINQFVVVIDNAWPTSKPVASHQRQISNSTSRANSPARRAASELPVTETVGSGLQLKSDLVVQQATCEQFSGTWQNPFWPTTYLNSVQLPSGRDWFGTNFSPPMVTPSVAARLAALRQMQWRPLTSLILTATSPDRLLLVSLFSSSTPQVQQLSSPQTRIEPEEPEVTTVWSMYGPPSNARFAISSAAYRLLGANSGPGPKIPCFDPARKEVQKSTRNPLWKKNSMANSMAQMQAAKESVSPGTPMGSSTSRRSLIVPRQLLKSLRYEVPLAVILRFRNCEVQFSESKLAMERSAGLGKMTARRVKYPQQQQMLLLTEYQDESAVSVVPGPVIVSPQTTLLMVLQSCTNWAAVKFGRMPRSAQRLPWSTSSTLKYCRAALMQVLTKGMKALLAKSGVKTASCWSQPMVKPQQLVVLQMKLPMASTRVWLERSTVQLAVELVSWARRVQLYLWPGAAWTVWSKMAYQLPSSCELMRQRWSRSSEKCGSRSGRSKATPIGLLNTQQSLEVIRPVKSAVDSTALHAQATRPSSATTILIERLNSKIIIKPQQNLLQHVTQRRCNP